MKLSELISNLFKIYNKYGDMDVILHDSADGTDVIAMSVYRDPGDEGFFDECVIGFDSGNDVR